jgi:hypothetical protein
MTFQVGMFCSEGVVLASDRKHTNMGGFRHSRIAPKIYVHDSEGLAYCSAGDDLCNVFTEIVRTENRKTCFAGREWLEAKQALIDCVLQARQAEDRFRNERKLTWAKDRTPQCIGGNTLLVFRDDKSFALWTVNTQAQSPWPELVEMNRLEVAGDANNPSIFFLAHYFPKIEPTVQAFLPLAVHSILMAKGEFVEDVEVGVFTRERFGILSEQELAPLIKRSDSLAGCGKTRHLSL